MDHVMRLCIKGSPEDAVKAASERNVPLLNVKASDRFNEAWAETDNQYVIQVVQWYGEKTAWTDGFGYDVGTLLLYKLG